VLTVVEREGKAGLAVFQASHMNILLGIDATPLKFFKVFDQVASDRNANPLKLLSVTITLKVRPDIKY